MFHAMIFFPTRLEMTPMLGAIFIVLLAMAMGAIPRRKPARRKSRPAWPAIMARRVQVAVTRARRQRTA
jgi:hypothetical protein